MNIYKLNRRVGDPGGCRKQLCSRDRLPLRGVIVKENHVLEEDSGMCPVWNYYDIGLWNKRIVDARTVADDGKPHACLDGRHVDAVKYS